MSLGPIDDRSRYLGRALWQLILTPLLIFLLGVQAGAGVGATRRRANLDGQYTAARTR